MSGSPRSNYLGINDLSLLPIILSKTEYGQHLPKVFIRAEKGNYEAQIMSGAEALAYYGSGTFSKVNKSFNHQTLFTKGLLSKGKVIIERMDMGGSSAASVHYIDIATKTESVKKRTATGGIDGTAADLVTDTDVYVIRHLTLNDSNPAIQDGTMFNEDGTPSKMYPIMSHSATNHGEYGNFHGYNIKPTPGQTTEKVLADGQMYYDLEKRATVFGTTTTVKSLSGSKTVKGGLQTGTDSVTQVNVLLDNMYEDGYYNEKDFNIEWRYVESKLMVHEDNVLAVAKLLAGREATFIEDNVVEDTNGDVVLLSDWYDLIGSVEEMEANAAVLDIITLKSTSGINYLTARVDIAPSHVNPAITFGDENSTFYMSGGSDVDATLTTTSEIEDHYNSKVKLSLAGYLDKNSPLQETALNPESTLYDSGFPLDVKVEMCNVIALRGDTIVTLSTYITNAAGDAVMTEDEEIAIGVLLKARLLLTPESTFYGTDTARAIICGGSCVAINTDYKGRIPTTYDLALKCAGYMGAGNKRWNRAKSFDSGDESAALDISEILPKFVPPSIKGKLWSIGINWLEPLYDRKLYHWPSFMTIASERSSLNSIFTVYAAAYICKLEILAWKYFSGESRLTPAAFIDKVNGYMSEQLRGKFGGRFLLQPVATITATDTKLGYSWHLNTRIGVNDMYTVVHNTVTVLRKRDF